MYLICAAVVGVLVAVVVRSFYRAWLEAGSLDLSEKLPKVRDQVKQITDPVLKAEAERYCALAQNRYEGAQWCLHDKQRCLSSACVNSNHAHHFLSLASKLARYDREQPSQKKGTQTRRLPAGTRLYSSLRFGLLWLAVAVGVAAIPASILVGFLTQSWLSSIAYLGIMTPLLALVLVVALAEYIFDGRRLVDMALLFVAAKRSGALSQIPHADHYLASFERLYETHLAHGETHHLWDGAYELRKKIFELSPETLEKIGLNGKDERTNVKAPQARVQLLSLSERTALLEQYGDVDLVSELFAAPMVSELHNWIKTVVAQKRTYNLTRMNYIVADQLAQFDADVCQLMPAVLLLYPPQVKEQVWSSLREEGYQVDVHENEVTGGTVAIGGPGSR